ncbi:hypothetical protein TREMEDRAFT_32134 [Tremella mesenterica DSM 1558]|uniref:uncharacterized protein n=1 Tax=Tremella mesenterica (strain ATCC 24925 / CBS 8224 / DSM 1558 / NBRC 9311 / NRRL Y-6157 / RJB 2259-6 / UBC 559-6) TaxID=578456 RepID=UPI0003F49C31|nr:uncharacterized protein TREMEDRAFT_32134 [Tremella mesenterica DSM 1558]EIW68367.1 hypothetical protein TREMEDRAFT_32134 [Tremella mesenterica DSM 1558]
MLTRSSNSHLAQQLSSQGTSHNTPLEDHPDRSTPLSIFAPPPPSDLPDALQEIVRPVVADNDGMVKDAAEGFENRLRHTRARLESVRSGVNASGRGVKVGGAPRTSNVSGRKPRKSKATDEIPNQDFCSACRGIGKFLCCDGCPRSFHFMCLDPPLLIDQLPEEETWYCRKCRAERDKAENASPAKEKEKELKPIPACFKLLTKKLEEENPVQFRLPDDIRHYFSGEVQEGPGGEYVDHEETRTRIDRKGFQEERDGTRLRDGKRPVSCYQCGGSSIPLGSLITDPGIAWRQIVSCDYCALHWHLDCLTPPLASMPNSGRKWMCPNHVEQAMARRRTVKSGLETIDVESVGTPNNGNILILPDDQPGLHYEDFVINKKRYRVPEMVIKLDFWDKLRARR